MNILFEAYKASTEEEDLVASTLQFLVIAKVFWLHLCLMNSKLNSFCFHDDSML
jgi:hypothetical protein